MKSYHIICPKCNNNHSFYRYGKDPDGYQKYLCRNCLHQFTPKRPRSEGQIVGGSIRLAPCAERFPFYITIMSIILTADAVAKIATILSLNGSLLLLLLHLCLYFLESIIFNNLISMFVFFFNFVRTHSALNGLTPAQVAGLNLSKRRKHEFLLVA